MQSILNAIYIECLIIQEAVIFVVLLFVACQGIFVHETGIVWKDVLLILGMMALLSLPYVIFIRGLFCDTVYYDEQGIKIVTRKETAEYAWDDIFRIERTIGGRSDTLGWTLVALSGEKYKLFPLFRKIHRICKNKRPLS